MKIWVARGVTLALSIALCLIGTEIFLRLFAPQPLNVLRVREDGVLSHEPNLDIELTGVDFSTRVRTNAAGLRDVERPERKPEGMTRVLVMGDSMIEGLQVELEETMPKQLGLRLADALPEREFDVINAGVSGSSGPSALRYLERDGLVYDPDLVISTVTTRNDVQEAAVTREVVLPVGYDLRVYLRARFHLYGLAEKVINAAPRLRNALAALGILSAAQPRPAAGGISDELYLYNMKLEPLEALGYEKLFEAYDGMIALCRERNIEILFVIIPSYFQATGYAAALGDPKSVGAVVKNDRETQDRLLAFFQGRGVEAVDLLPDMRRNAESYYLPTDRHFTAAGNARAAEITARAILERGFLSGEPPGGGPEEPEKGG